MKNTIMAMSVLVAFAMVSLPAVADHDGGCEVTSSEPTAEAGGIAVFVDDPNDTVSVWIYEESNEIEGFQRDDSVVQDELCGHDGDTVIL